jgi:DNA-binding beta-propeller fold protein YncE
MKSWFLGVALAALLAPAAQAQAVQETQRQVDQGIGVDFSALGPTRPGEPLALRFQFSDTASSSPLAGLRPAAWLSWRTPGAAVPDCKAKVATYLGGDRFQRAEVDLNSYFVLTLNDDPSISVVDPLFGLGGAKLLALLPLASRAADWALAEAASRLFVSMPAAGKVAVADTLSWRLVGSVATGPNPRRVVTVGRHAWVSDDQGLSAIDVKTLAVTALRIGASTDLAAAPEGELVFASSARRVFIIDAPSATVRAQVTVDGTPTLLAYSTAAQAVYALDAAQGRVFAVDAHSGKLMASVQIRPGATQIRFAPNGRFALIPNPLEDTVQVLDAASNRIVQTAALPHGPDRISFTDLLAYVHRRDSERVLMVPLDQLGIEGKGLGVADFPGGQHALGDTGPTLADAIVRAPEGPAVLLANPADQMIYLYKEGMAAPAGGFSTDGHTPRAVLVVDHGLREVRRGLYATSVPVARPGTYDVVMFVNSPRVMACFSIAIFADSTSKPPPAITLVSALDPPAHLASGTPVRLRFALTDGDGHPLPPASDLRARAFRAPGVWQQRADTARLPDGSYAFEFVPPDPGTYYVWLESASLGLANHNPQFTVYQAD